MDDHKTIALMKN